MREISSAVVTGATGAIGTALCKLMVQQKIEVYAIVRRESNRVSHLRDIDGLKIVECDVANLSKLSVLMPEMNADAFFHLAWEKTVGQGRNDMDAQLRNIQYTIDAVRTAAMMKSRVFVGAGSQAEYGRVDHALRSDTPCFPENGYGMAKLCAGQMSRVECEKLGVDHIWPRILSVYGQYDGMKSMVMSVIKKLLNAEKPLLTAGDQIWDYLFADDAANALYRMALYGRSGAVYPLGSGEAHHLRKYIEIIRDAIDPKLPLGFGEVPYGGKQVMHLEADISALREDTGFEPNVGFEEGIRKTIDYVRRMTNG